MLKSELLFKIVKLRNKQKNKFETLLFFVERKEKKKHLNVCVSTKRFDYVFKTIPRIIVKRFSTLTREHCIIGFCRQVRFWLHSCLRLIDDT